MGFATPQKGFQVQQKNDNQLCFTCLMLGHRQTAMFYVSGRGSGGGRFGRIKSSGKRTRLEVPHVCNGYEACFIFLQTAFHYLGCIFERYFG